MCQHMSDDEKKPYTFRLDPPLLKAMQDIQEADGPPVSAQIRRGIVLWLKSKGVGVDTSGKAIGRSKRAPKGGAKVRG